MYCLETKHLNLLLLQPWEQGFKLTRTAFILGVKEQWTYVCIISGMTQK
jgi:hypothetical protein